MSKGFNLQIRDYDVTAGVPFQLAIPATFFQLMDAAGTVDIEVIREHSVIGNAAGVSEGFSFGGADEELFHAVNITSATTQTLKICLSRGSADLRQIVGNVTINDQQGTHTQTAATVTNASGLILAANATRRFLMVQNHDTAANMWLATDGAAAVADGSCIKIGPGATLILDAYPPTGALYAISDAATMQAHVSEG